MRLYAALLAALALLVGCTDQMMQDALSGPQARCEEARAIYASLTDPTTKERAMVLAVCADLIV